MTIKEFYNWAVNKGVENAPLGVIYDCENQDYSFVINEIREFIFIDGVSKRCSVYISISTEDFE